MTQRWQGRLLLLACLHALLTIYVQGLQVVHERGVRILTPPQGTTNELVIGNVKANLLTGSKEEPHHEVEMRERKQAERLEADTEAKLLKHRMNLLHTPSKQSRCALQTPHIP